MAVRVDVVKCTGCFQCVLNCPYALFEVVDGKARVVDNTQCISCGICKQSCENGAINVIPGKNLGGGNY